MYGLPRDMAKAVELWSIAAEKGHVQVERAKKMLLRVDV